MASLEERHLADLTFPEVSRALRALSFSYVEGRTTGRDTRGAVHGALSGAGKRAAFALFYGPLHYMFVDRVVARLGTSATTRMSGRTLIDLGCGTGGAGASWAFRARMTRVIGIDRNTWALAEAARTYRGFGLRVETRRGELARVRLPKVRAALLAAFVLNELSESDREALLHALLLRAETTGDPVLIVEPIARSVAPWWDKWAGAFADAGGSSAEWRFDVELPPMLRKLDRAAGLKHRELTGRTLYFSSKT
jgi:predicted RNA methylase